MNKEQRDLEYAFCFIPIISLSVSKLKVEKRSVKIQRLAQWPFMYDLHFFLEMRSGSKKKRKRRWSVIQRLSLTIVEFEIERRRRRGRNSFKIIFFLEDHISRNKNSIGMKRKAS